MAKRLLPIAVALTVMLAASAGNAVLAGFAGSLSDPVSAPINGGYLYGEILSSGDTWGHAGVDWSISSGGTVRAATAGSVSYSGVDLTLLTSGTAVGGGSNYIILASTASSVNGAYNNKVVHLSAGTGAGQSRIITSYEGATRKAYISSSDPWNPIPNTTTSYRVGTYAGYGEYIRLSHSSGSYYTLYAHLQKRMVLSGSVSSGQQIGLSGETGNVTGAHLHFEVRVSPGTSAAYVRNPECWLARSNQSPYGAVRGKVMDDLGTILNQVRVSGASKPTDINYGASYTYALNKYDGYQQFGDVSAYNINYYIGRAAAGSITLTFTKTGYTTQTMGVTISGGQDNPLSTVVMP